MVTNWLFLQDVLREGDTPLSDTGRLVDGGIENIENTRGEVLSTQPSGFFPTPQREQVISEMHAPAGAEGQTYRDIIQENQSMIETDWWNRIGWIGTPYEQQYAEIPKRRESIDLSESVSGTVKEEMPQNLLGDILGTIRAGGQIGTVVSEFLYNWGITDREPVRGTPRAGYPAGTDDTHYSNWTSKAADVVTVGKRIGGAFLNQVKGLFNLGYKGPEGPQPVFAIQHELEPSVKIGAIGIVAIILLVIFLIRRK
jgi:hypothetical protein